MYQTTSTLGVKGGLATSKDSKLENANVSRTTY